VIASPEVRKKVLSPTRLDQVLPIVETVTPCIGAPVPLAIPTAAGSDMTQHIYECHAQLAEVEGPQQKTFAHIAEQMKRELRS
jgi:hypothetical protein